MKNTYLKSFLFSLVVLLSSFVSHSQQNILISQGGSVSVNDGDNFYDAGGVAVNDTNISYTITLTPAVAGEMVYLDFTLFKTHYSGNNLGDFVEIYDGITLAANQLAKITGDFSTSPASGGLRVNSINGIAAVTNPGIFAASNATGALTIKFTNNYATTAVGFAAIVKTYKPFSTSGSSLNIKATPNTICPGGSTLLNATGAVFSLPLNNDFNFGNIGTGWATSVTANFTNPTCATTGLDGVAHLSTYLWMSNVAYPRSLASNGLDVSNGGTISFDYRQAIQASSSPCEGPDVNGSGSTAEGIFIQYSLNGGTTWITFDYLFPRDDNQNSFGSYYPGTGRFVESWRNIIIPIPTAAKSNNTKFRWHQELGTGPTYDNWGLDNVVVATPKTSTLTITNMTTNSIIATTTSGTTSITVSPIATTIYRASITDGITTNTQDITVTVNSGIPTTIGYPTGSTTLATTALATVVTTITGSPATAGTYTATPAGLTISASNGQITPSTSTLGTYTVSATTACGTTNATVVIAASTCACADGAGTCGGAHFTNVTTAQTDFNNAASLVAAHTFLPVISSPNGTVKQFCWAYTTGASETSVGFINAINSLHTLDGNGCTFTRTYQVAQVGSCTTPLTNTGATPFGNGFTYTVLPNTQYNFCVTITVNDATCVSISDNFVWVYNNSTLAGCTTCATATCTPSSIVKTTAALGQTGITTVLNSAGDQIGINPLTAGQSATVCVPVTVPSGSTVLGFKNNISTGPGCAVPSNLNITYQLRLASNCASAAIAPNLANASSVGSGFNPEWNNLAAGNYVLCYTVAVNAAMDPILCPNIDLFSLGYYNVVPAVVAINCQDYQIQMFDDDTLNTTHSGTSFLCTDSKVFLGPVNGPSNFDDGLPYPALKIVITALFGNTSNLVLNRYDPVTGLAEVLTFTSPMNNYFINAAPGQYYTLDKTNGASGTYSYVITDAITGAVLTSGTWTITGGVESGPSATVIPSGTSNYSGAGVSNGFDPAGLDNYTNNRGIGVFDPCIAGVGSHTITYSWNNGLIGANNCTITRTKNVTVTGSTSAPTATGSSICFGSTATITATANAGNVIKWYNAASGGALLFTGNPFTTPALTATTSYWVTQTSTCCGESPRTQVTITITPGTAAAYTKASVTCDPGSVTFSGISSGTTFNWVSGPAGYMFTTPTNSNLTGLPVGNYCVDITSPNTPGGTVNTTLLTEDFESALVNWTIDNTGGGNQFIINNVYPGGTCTIGGIPFAVPTVPSEGTWATAGPTSKYLHIKATTTCGFTCAEAAFPPSNANYCSTTSYQKFTLNTPLNTIGKTNVTFSFYYINGVTDITSDYGKLEYSINGGTTWIQSGTNLISHSTWFNQISTNAAWANQASLLFRITWNNNASSSTDPPLAIDQIIIIGNQTSLASCGTTVQECFIVNPVLKPTINCGTTTTTSVQFTWTAVTGATGYSVSYQIGSNPIVTVGAIGNVLNYNVTGLIAGASVKITVTPTGSAGTCFGLNTKTCVAVACSPPTATISYSPAAYCQSTTTAQSINLTGTGIFSGGLFTSSPAGLSMNAGAITPSGSTASATPYTVTYTIAAIAGCSPVVATTTVLINATPSAPAVTTVQPTCTTATGSVTITGVVGETYSIDGSTYTATLIYSGLLASSTHTFYAKNAAGCISAVTSITLNAQPVTPNAPAVTTVHPTCTNATGSITITGVVGETYSIDGSLYTATLIYSGLLASSTHTFYAKNAAGCVSAITSTTLNAQPATPNAPVVTTVQPTCTTATGSITITGVVGETYSFDGSLYTGTLVYSGLLASSTHTFEAKNATGCISAVTSITLNAQPVTPNAPVVTTVQPTCTTATGSITITGVVGETYSFDGSNYTATLIYSGLLASSTHTFEAKNATGCISAVTSITLNAQLVTPNAPVVTTVQPTCTTATGSITITGVLGETYSFDGSFYTGTLVYSGLLASSTHTFYAKNTAGCISAVTSVTLNAQPATPSALVNAINNSICSGAATNINISSLLPLTTFTWVSVINNATGVTSGSGDAISQIVTTTGNSIGTAIYTIIPTANGCNGLPVNITITIKPTPTIIATPTTETICSLQSTGISLSSSLPTATISWSVSQAGAIGATSGTGNAISQVLTATGAALGNVVYTAISLENGCFSTPINIPIIVTPKPTVIATPILQSICSGNAPNIILNGAMLGTTFAWNSVATNVNGASSGTTAIISQPLTTIGDVSGEVVYSITPFLNGCPGLPITVTIKVNPIPVITANPTNAIICSGETTAINLTSTVSGTMFSWSVLQSGIFGASSGSGSQINQTLTTVGLVSGNVVYIITPTANGCLGLPIRVSVVVNPTPELFGNPTQLPICSGEDTQIILTPKIIGTTFAWTNTQNGVTGAVDGTGGSIIQTLETTGISFGTAGYAVTPTLNGCIGNTIIISVRVNPLPTPTLTDGIICEDLAGNLLKPYLLNTGLSSSNLEFEWYFNGIIIPGAVGNTYSAEESGIYSVQVKNLTTGCISLQTATSATVITKNPGLSLIAEASIAFSDDASIIATVTGGSGDFEYSLDNGQFQTSNIFTPVESGLHTVVVRDINGCTNLTASALVIGYPTYFTPNGDSIHDYWNIIGFELINNSKIFIFDRYGKLIKQINPLGQGWDGTYNENPMPSTDYWFTTDYFDTLENKYKVFRSHFSLKR